MSQLDVTDTDYMGGFQYVAGKLSFIPHAEGYVNVILGNNGNLDFNYVYQYKDHLGNIRLSYSFLEEQLYDPGQPIQFQILEENHYYPFGLKHTNYNTTKYEFVKVESGNDYYINIEQLPLGSEGNYKYKYNGKEYQDELGLNMYDYGARNYDPTLGRWMNIDPLAETSRRWSTYTYCYNNPMRFVDPDGMRAFDWKTNAQGQLVFDKNLTEANASTQLKENETYIAKSFVAKDQNGDYYNFSEDGKQSKVDASSISEGTEVIEVASNWRTTSEEKSVSATGESTVDQLGTALLVSQNDGILPGPADILATMIVLKVIYEAVTGSNSVTVSEQTLEFAAQRGKNNGRLQDDELESILARKSAGTATSSDLQKLKKHEKNTNQRSSRQSKDRK